MGPTVEKISKTPVEAGPGLCPFETRHLFTASQLENERCIFIKPMCWYLLPQQTSIIISIHTDLLFKIKCFQL